MPAVCIRVLGPLDIQMEDGEPLVFESVKARALLAYLAVEAGRVHSRESIAGLLWPERPDSGALANLRHTLSSLRSSLGERLKDPGGTIPPLFNTQSNAIQFNLAAGAWVDLGEFEQRLTAAELAGERHLPARIEQLGQAVQLYRGRFLEGFSLKGCPEFEDWMLLRRENTSLKLQKALGSLAAAQETAGDWEAALASLRQLLQIEPWDESTHRKVMALLAVHDQRSAALSQYELCCQLLRDELGVAPEEETVRLYEQIRQGSFTGFRQVESGKRLPREWGGAGKRPAKRASTAFVGRQPQLAQLRKVLDLALNGRGQLVFITGEAGSGKTSLAWEFASQAMDLHPDLLAAAGYCNAITGFEAPYLPFREIVQMLAGTMESQPFHQLAPDHLRRLTSAFPDIIKVLLTHGPDLIGSFIPREMLAQHIETFGPGKAAWQAEFKGVVERAAESSALAPAPGGLAYKPVEAMTRMLVELARLHPLVLFLDDLQWADVGSISLLHYLCKRLAGSRVVVIGAYRPQDVALGRRSPNDQWERHPLEPVRLELQREFGEMGVDLDQSEGMAFVEALLDTEPNRLGRDFRQTLYHQTNGNPLFVLELLRSMQARGDIVHDAGGRWVEGPALDWEKLPARVEAVIAERTGRLPPDQQALLRAASVEGETFTAEVTARVLGLDEGQVVRWLSGPLSREQQIVRAQQVVRGNPANGGEPARLSRYRFRHILFQKYLYHRLDPVERSELHELTGAALEKLYQPPAGDIPLQLAWHFEQAGLLAQAAEYLLAAGRGAVNLSAHSQAKHLYDRCLGLIQQLPKGAGRDRLEIRVQLARGAPLLSTDGWGSPEAVQAVNRAVELLNQPGENSTDPEILLALYFQADHFTAQNNMAEAMARVELLLQRITPGSGRAYQVLAYLVAGQTYFFSGQPAMAQGYLEKTIACYHPDDQDFLTGVSGVQVMLASLTWLAWVQWVLGHPGRAMQTRQRAIALSRQGEDAFNSGITVALAGSFLAVLMDEAELAEKYARECLEPAALNKSPIATMLSKTILGWVQVRRGEYEGGMALMNEGISEWKTSGAQTLLPASMMLYADALSRVGQTRAALDVLATLVDMIDQTGRRGLEAYLYWLQGEILARHLRQAGADGQAELTPAALYERAIAAARQQQARSLELRATNSLARCLIEAGQAQEAYLRVKEIYSYFEVEGETPDLRQARSLLAELATRRDHPPAAR